MRTWAVFALAWSFFQDSRKIARAKRRQHPEQAARSERDIYRAGGERFRREAFRLGGLIIKVGQFLSARTDVLPLDFTRELAVLQDQVPAAPWPQVEALLDAAYGGGWRVVFSEFDADPLAAASLGQVHRARLAESGQWVAVKVQRPGILDLAATDLSALGYIMRAISRWTKVGRRINAERLFEEFRSLVGQELDYLHEQKNLEAFSQHFAAIDEVRVPRAYPDYTRPKVLVMELVEGVKLTDAEGLRAYGLDPKRLARTLVTTYFKQIIVDGLVQIDPHPGNFLADAQGQLVLLDFGMCGEIPATQMPYAAKLIQGILAKDAQQVVQAIAGLGFIRPEADARLLVRSMNVLLQQVGGVQLEPGPVLNQAVADFQDFLYQEPLEFPAEYMFLGRAIGMLFSLVSQLDDSVDWLDLIKKEALPMINAKSFAESGWQARIGEWVGALLGAEAETATRVVLGRVGEEMGRLGRLPASLERVLNQIEAGGVKTEPAWTPMLRRVDLLSQEMRLLIDTVFLGVAFSGWLFWSRSHAAITPWLLAASIVAAVFWLKASLSLIRMRRRMRPRRIGRDPRSRP
ncbi:MAG: AarF/UbiB family protein [Firmicutes bacterium]|nr:AarF/UbiB family protein [Bacillota bacterium]